MLLDIRYNIELKKKKEEAHGGISCGLLFYIVPIRKVFKEMLLKSLLPNLFLFISFHYFICY